MDLEIKNKFLVTILSKGSNRSEKILSDIFNFRKINYEQLGWILNKNSAHLIKDKFDDIAESTHFALYEEGEIIGSHRMTKYSWKNKLPYIRDGLPLRIFNIQPQFCSEATRLIIKQDKKYPGAAKQLFFSTTKHMLENYSKNVVSIGFTKHLGFFEVIGYKSVNEARDIVLDESGDDKVIRSGTPIVASLFTLNYRLDINKYNPKREFVIIEND